MRKILLWGCLFFCCSLTLSAQQRINNVRFQLDSKSKLIEINYDALGLLEADSVYISVTGKKTRVIVPKQLSGDIGKGVKSGKNRKIIWDVVGDNLKINDDLVIKVNVLISAPPMLAAADSAKRKPPKVASKTRRGLNGTALLMLGGGIAVGGGMYYLSTVQKAASAKTYELYKQRNWNHDGDLTLIGNDPDLKKQYDASLDQAKSDYNKAKRQMMLSKIMMFGGIGIAVADAVFTIPVLFTPKNKKVSLRLELDSWGIASAGLQLKF